MYVTSGEKERERETDFCVAEGVECIGESRRDAMANVIELHKHGRRLPESPSSKVYNSGVFLPSRTLVKRYGIDDHNGTASR